jgi:hypothetical protein
MANRVLHAAALQPHFELNGLPLAPPGRRAWAFAIDVALLIIPSVIAACFAAGGAIRTAGSYTIASRIPSSS